MSHKPDSWTYGKPEANEWYGEFISVHSAERDDERLALVWDEEDAVLIAAAPDMLEALKAAALILANEVLAGDPLMIQVLDAIAKAKGE